MREIEEALKEIRRTNTKCIIGQGIAGVIGMVALLAMFYGIVSSM